MTKKEIAQNFLQLAAQGASRQAFELYAADTFQHHNPFFKGDSHSLIAAMEDAAAKDPEKVFDIQRMLEDGDLVAVHSRVQLAKSATEMAIIHILRFDEDKIVELWDIAQAAPTQVVNEQGMF